MPVPNEGSGAPQLGIPAALVATTGRLGSEHFRSPPRTRWCLQRQAGGAANRLGQTGRGRCTL